MSLSLFSPAQRLIPSLAAALSLSLSMTAMPAQTTVTVGGGGSASPGGSHGTIDPDLLPCGWRRSVRFYVDGAVGSNTNNGSIASPFASIGYALAQAQLVWDSATNARSPVVIEVAPGLYAESLVVPARGLKLQAGEPGVIIDATSTGAQQVVLVNRPGPRVAACGYMPPTELRDLTLRGAERFGIWMEPSSTAQGPLPEPERVEVVGCTVTGNAEGGIWIRTIDPWRCEHLIEANTIVGNFTTGAASYGVRITASGVDSTVVRRNDIVMHEKGIEIGGSGSNRVRPRVMSNFIRHFERGVEAVGSGPWIVNNTIAWPQPFSDPQFLVNFIGVNLSSLQDTTVANNIIWIPDLDKIDGIDMVPEVQSPSILNNDFEDDDNPNVWVLGNVNIPPPFVSPTDLHLLPFTPASPIELYDGGSRPSILDPLPLTVDGIDVPADQGRDIDGDVRSVDNSGTTVFPFVGMGADEAAVVGLTYTDTAAVDVLGNVSLSAGAPPLNLRVTGPTGATVNWYAWMPSVSTSNDPDWFNRYDFMGAGGHYLLPLAAPSVSLFATTTISGGVSVPPVDPALPMVLEAELYVQAFVRDVAGGEARWTNRLRFEMNQ